MRRTRKAPSALTNQHDFKTRIMRRPARTSALDRKIYRIAHGNNATRQRTFQTRFNLVSSLLPNQQIATTSSLSGFNTATINAGDLTRIMGLELLSAISDIPIYLKSANMTINMRNNGTREQQNTVYKITASKRFNSSVEINLISVLGASSTAPALSNNHWVPFMASDKLSQYGLSVAATTKYLVNPGESVTYVDHKNYGSRRIISDLQGTFGDNEPGVTVHYLVLSQDIIGDSVAAPPNLGIEYIRKYTYAVQGVNTSISTITYL